MKSLADRFITCLNEKNYTLIRFDIIQDLRNLFDELKDEEIKQAALDLIEKEEDLKYKKKYASVWKKS
jgi:tyrosine-protein phosphatase YwqE